MTSAIRALACTCMLAGFYLVGLIEFVIVVAFLVWFGSVTHPLLGRVVAYTVLGAFGLMAVAAWRAMRAKNGPPHGLQVSRADAPELWSAVDRLAGEAGTRAPDEIRLVPEVNAAVSENARLLGLIGGRRYLYIGIPLLHAMRVDQLSSVIAHELGHYSGKHTRLGGVAYRGRLAIMGTVREIGGANPIGWGFKAYAHLYLMVDNALSRRQEREADLTAVRVAGRDAAASALRDLPVLDAAWDFYFGKYVTLGWEYGLAPDDVFGGFTELVRARREELDSIREQEPPNTRSKWSTHPPVAERIATIMELPETAEAADPRPAGVLLGDLDAANQALQQVVVDIGDRTLLPWPEYTHASLTAQMQRSADRMLRKIGRVDGGQALGGAEPSLSAIFDAIAAGRAADLAEPFFPDATRRELGPLFAKPLELLLDLAAIRSGVARWRHSWSEPAALLSADGTEVPTAEIAELAVSPDGLGKALHRLTELGIDPGTVSLVERSANAIGAQVIAAMANCKVDGVPYDLLVLSNGFVFVPDPGKTDKGKARLQAIVSAARPSELAAQNRFLPYEEVASAKLVKNTPLRAELTLHSGQTVEIRELLMSESITGKCRENFAEVIGRLG